MEGLFYRSFELDRTKVDEEKREAELSFSSETPIRRWFGEEILLHGRNNVDLSRLKSVGAVLYGHRPDDIKNIIGPVRKCWLDEEKRVGRAIMGFDEDETGNLAIVKVKSKSLRGVSFGYLINKARKLVEKEEWTDPDTKVSYRGPAVIATRWTPYEISLTPIPADASIGVGRELTRSLENIEFEKGGFVMSMRKNGDQEQPVINQIFPNADLREVVRALHRAAKLFGGAELRAEMWSDSCLDRNTQEEILGAMARTFNDHFEKSYSRAVDHRKSPGRITTFKGLSDENFFRAIENPVFMLADDVSTRQETTIRRTDPAPITSFSQLNEDSFFRGLLNPRLI